MRDFSVDAGKLRHRITFQEFSGNQDTYGDPLVSDDVNWKPVATAWASIDALRGREFLAAQQGQGEVTHRIICRYRPGLTTATRIIKGTRKFDIVPPIRDPEERHQWLEIMARELVE